MGSPAVASFFDDVGSGVTLLPTAGRSACESRDKMS